jgi:lysozyme
MRKINSLGLDLIKSFEGLQLKSYLCPAKVWTIGYGSTGKDIGPGLSWTKEQAEERLARDLLSFEMGVDRALRIQVNENQFSALVCFAYNVGTGALEKSTLLRLLNTGDFTGASKEFGKWNKAAGKELAGLTRRREAECKLFNTPVVNQNGLKTPSKEDIEVKLEEIEKEALKT